MVAPFVEIDSVESAEGRGNLVLPASRLVAKSSFKINCVVGKLLFGTVLTL